MRQMKSSARSTAYGEGWRNSRLATAISLVSISLILGALIFGWLSRNTPIRDEYWTWENRLADIFSFLGPVILGWVIASKKPENQYGWLWVGFGLTAGFMEFFQSYAIYGALTAPGSLPAVELSVGLTRVTWVIYVTFIPLLLMLFPTGKLPSKRWKWVILALQVFVALGIVVSWFQPGKMGTVPLDNPYGIVSEAWNFLIPMIDLMVFSVISLIVLACVILIIRFRKSTGQERLQLKWVAFSASLLILYFISEIVFDAISFQLPELIDSDILFYLIFSTLYITIAIAILKYKLYNIDNIIRKSLVYGLLTAALAMLYFSSVVVLQNLSQVLTGWSNSPSITVISTLAIAAMFNPFRKRIQAVIDRRFFRLRYNASETLAAFSADLRNEVDLDQLQERLVKVVERSFQPEQVWLWVRETNPHERDLERA